MLKVWAHKLTGKFIRINCDNLSVVQVLNSGWAKDEKLQVLMREVVYIAATSNFEHKALHVMGKNNTLLDLLSHWHEGLHVQNKFRQITQDEFRECVMNGNVFNLMHVN